MSVKPVRTTGKLNAVSDTYPGGGNVSPGLAPGQPGQIIEIRTFEEALRMSDTAVGTLYPGRYMYVLSKSAATATPARGQAALLEDLETFSVSADGAAAKDGKVAGVFISALAKGKYGWVYIGGPQVVVQLKSSVTDTTDGDGLYIDTTTANWDALADATADATAGPAKRRMGVLLEAPANSGLKKASFTGGLFAGRSPTV